MIASGEVGGEGSATEIENGADMDIIFLFKWVQQSTVFTSSFYTSVSFGLLNLFKHI